MKSLMMMRYECLLIVECYILYIVQSHPIDVVKAHHACNHPVHLPALDNLAKAATCQLNQTAFEDEDEDKNENEVRMLLIVEYYILYIVQSYPIDVVEAHHAQNCPVHPPALDNLVKAATHQLIQMAFEDRDEDKNKNDNNKDNDNEYLNENDSIN
jgi:hypothetical protein